MGPMDDTTQASPDQSEADGADQLEALRRADPADAPQIAETLADDLQRALDETEDER